MFTPALKLANWLEFYADSLELNVWTSSTVLSAKQDTSSKAWTVRVRLPRGNERELVVNHVVFAVGIGGGIPNIPEYPGTVCGNFVPARLEL
jgi:cation diffusion facilitator CzcD-associated flavoprotein CzcO